MQIEFRIAAHGSPEYDKTVGLRYRVLREPLGLGFTAKQLAEEANQIHIYGISGNQVAACLVLMPLQNGEIKMRQVAVDNHLQGSGIGTQMVAFAEKLALENGYKLMTLHARQTAVPFYSRLDYKITGGPFIEVGIPHRKMEKILG
jgi:predicted GNAT family N-acyltransferase